MTEPDSSVSLSIVVCTLNRCAELRDCLEALLIQVQGRPAEIIVVDNGSADDTRSYVQSRILTRPQLRYLREQITGLSVARNTGWQLAKGAYIAYIDDDAIPADDWVATILEIAASAECPAMFGGPHERIAKERIPAWLPDGFGRLNWGAEVFDVSPPATYVPGSNMVIQRSVLQEQAGFDARFGRVGNTLWYADETEFECRLVRSGGTIRYYPWLRVSHLIHSYRLRPGWHLKEVFQSGRAFSAARLNRGSVGRQFLVTGHEFLKGAGQLFSRRHRDLETRMMAACRGPFHQLGILVGFLDRIRLKGQQTA